MIPMPEFKGTFVPSPIECEKCGKSLKGTKSYSIEGNIQIGKNHYTPRKRCKRCGTLNISVLGRRR